MADKKPKDPKAVFKKKLVDQFAVPNDLAETLVSQVVPDAVEWVLEQLPISLFENVFQKRQILWKFGGMALGYIIRLRTNLPPLADQVITEVGKEISEKIEVVALKRSGKTSDADGKVSPMSAKEKDDFIKIVKTIATSDVLNEDQNVKVWESFNSLKTYYTALKLKEQKRFIKLLAEFNAIDYLSFVKMPVTDRDEFLNFFFNQEEVPEKNYLKEYYEKAKTFVKTNAQKVDNTLATDQPLGKALRNLFRIPNSN